MAVLTRGTLSTQFSSPWAQVVTPNGASGSSRCPGGDLRLRDLQSRMFK
jgi:hypothetical protein